MRANAIQAARDHWVEKPARLRFTLAGGVVFSAEFPALCWALRLDLDCFRRTLPQGVSAEPPVWTGIPAQVRATRLHVPCARPYPRVTILHDTIRYAPSHYRRFYIEIQGGFEDYLRKFSGRTRSTWRRKVRRFASASGGAIDFQEYGRAATMSEFLVLARRVSEKTYQERLLDAGIPATGWYREQILQAAARDEVRGYLLFHQGQPVAYALCAADEDTLVVERIGFDPDFAYLNPGTVLLYLLLEKLFAGKRFHILDLGRGEFPYKEHYATGNIPCAEIYYFRRSASNLLLVCAHAAAEMLSGALKSGLEVLGLKDKVRRWLHRLAGGARVG